MEFLEDTTQQVESSAIEQLEIAEMLSPLTERERKAITLAYVAGNSDNNNVEVGMMIGVSKQRVAQLKNQAITKIRHAA